MPAVWATAVWVLICGCRMAGAETHYGLSPNEASFGEFKLVLEDAEGSPIQGVPFLVAGKGTLPERYGDDETYDRVSLGQLVRLPVKLFAGRVIAYLEAGGMISYYQSDAIGTPFEPELTGGVGFQVDLGKRWALDLGARVRQPMGNGNDHDEPEHAPHESQPEFFFGLRKDF
jgi:hypothetical protein